MKKMLAIGLCVLCLGMALGGCTAKQNNADMADPTDMTEEIAAAKQAEKEAESIPDTWMWAGFFDDLSVGADMVLTEWENEDGSYNARMDIRALLPSEYDAAKVKQVLSKRLAVACSMAEDDQGSGKVRIEIPAGIKINGPEGWQMADNNDHVAYLCVPLMENSEKSIIGRWVGVELSVSSTDEQKSGESTCEADWERVRNFAPKDAKQKSGAGWTAEHFYMRMEGELGTTYAGYPMEK